MTYLLVFAAGALVGHYFGQIYDFLHSVWTKYK